MPSKRATSPFSTLFRLVLVLLSSAGASQGQTGQYDQEIARLSALNSLEASQIGPWHLAASYVRFDSKDGIEGKIDVWSAEDGRTRVQLDEPGRKDSYVLTAQGRLRSLESKHLPQDVEMFVADLIHPFPTPLSFEVEREQDGQQVGVAHTNCLVLRQPSVSRAPSLEAGKVPTFCADEKGRLVTVWPVGFIKVVNDQISEYQGHFVAARSTVFFGKSESPMLKGKLEAVEPWQGKAEVATDAYVPDVLTGPVRVSGAVMQAQRTSGDAPLYPRSARQDHVAGTVILAATIGKDGRVGNLNVVSSPRDDLTAAAVESVKRWVYRPYQLNGNPVEVNTTVTVNFGLAP